MEGNGRRRSTDRVAAKDNGAIEARVRSTVVTIARLIPAWAKDPGLGHRLVNSRAETAAAKPSFRAAFSKRRCLVPADWFYA